MADDFPSFWSDPEHSAMRQTVRNGLRRVQAAQAGGYGSVAQRWDPNNYGSVESREMPGLFGPTGSLNPVYQQQVKAQADAARMQQRAALGLRARVAAAQQMGLGANFNLMAGLFGGGGLGSLGGSDDDDEGEDDGF